MLLDIQRTIPRGVEGRVLENSPSSPSDHSCKRPARYNTKESGVESKDTEQGFRQIGRLLVDKNILPVYICRIVDEYAAGLSNSIFLRLTANLIYF